MQDMYDVAILGSGMVGSTLALALARNHARVAIFDSAQHPRFALGESTIPPTSFWLKLLAERWNVPELHAFATAATLNREVAASSGVKRNFSFVVHEPGTTEPARAWVHAIPGSNTSRNGECHLFRQDVDAHLYHSAIAAGCTGHAPIQIERVDFASDGVTLNARDGRTFRARVVVDATGQRSLLANQLGLREQPTRLRTHSRTTFTHMIGVQPFDDVYEGPAPISRFHDGTLHHIFDGGWIWVIPFDNHPDSRNRLCSVGLSLDCRRFPRQHDVTPQSEWEALLAKFPLIAKQFANARPVRDWVATERTQYSSRESVGDRFIMTTHAAGAVDALYSLGLGNSLRALDTTIRLLLQAISDDNFSRERFAPLEVQQRNLLDLHDSIVYGAYVGFRDPALLDQWLGIWDLADKLFAAPVLHALQTFARTGDRASLAVDDGDPKNLGIAYEEFRALLDRCVAIASDVESARTSVTDARAAIGAALDELCTLIPYDHRAIRRSIGVQAFSRHVARRLSYDALVDRIADWIPKPRGLWKLGLANYGPPGSWTTRVAKLDEVLRRRLGAPVVPPPPWVLGTRYERTQPLTVQRDGWKRYTLELADPIVVDAPVAELCAWVGHREGSFAIEDAIAAVPAFDAFEAIAALDELARLGAVRQLDA